jgi:hypothetical protein
MGVLSSDIVKAQYFLFLFLYVGEIQIASHHSREVKLLVSIARDAIYVTENVIILEKTFSTSEIILECGIFRLFYKKRRAFLEK